MLVDCLHSGKKLNLSTSTHNPQKNQLSRRVSCICVWLWENVSSGLRRLPRVAAGVEGSGGGTLQAEGRARQRYEGARDLPAGRTEREWDSF